MEYMQIADKIIEYTNSILDKKLNESIYISLADHIRAAVERSKNGVTVQNVLLWEIKRFFPKEFQIGKKAVEEIDQVYSIRLLESEAGFIAMHLVNAQLGVDDKSNMYELTKMLREITNIVQYYFKVTIDEESVYFYRFTTHLKFFITRMKSDTPYGEETDEELLTVIKDKYRNAHECVQKIAFFLEEKYDYEISNDESLYLTIHIARLVQKNSCK